MTEVLLVIAGLLASFAVGYRVRDSTLLAAEVNHADAAAIITALQRDISNLPLAIYPTVTHSASRATSSRTDPRRSSITTGSSELTKVTEAEIVTTTSWVASA